MLNGRLSGAGQMALGIALAYNPEDEFGELGLDAIETGREIMEPGQSLAGAQFVQDAGGMSYAANPVPTTMARVVPQGVPLEMLGRPGEADVFVTAAEDIAGLNGDQIAERLSIPRSPTGFSVVEFPTPSEGVASPVFRANPQFVGGGLTEGGAREFVVPNGPLPADPFIWSTQ